LFQALRGWIRGSIWDDIVLSKLFNMRLRERDNMKPINELLQAAEAQKLVDQDSGLGFQQTVIGVFSLGRPLRITKIPNSRRLVHPQRVPELL
jgi:hypothetical protein